MSVLQKPDKPIDVIKGKRLADELRDIVRQQGLDLSLADMNETKKILASLKIPLSQEIINAREGNE